MHNLQVSPCFTAALTTVLEHIASGVSGWHLGGESPELGQCIFCDICEKSDRESQQLSCPLLLTAVLLLSPDATLENLQLPDRAEPFTSSGTEMGHTVMRIDQCPKMWFMSYIYVLNYSKGKADHYSPVSHVQIQPLNE